MHAPTKHRIGAKRKCIALYRLGIPPTVIQEITCVPWRTVQDWVPQEHHRPHAASTALSRWFRRCSLQAVFAVTAARLYWNGGITESRIAEMLRDESPDIFALSDAFVYLNLPIHVEA